MINILEKYIKENTVFFNEKNEVVNSIEESTYAKLNDLKINPHMNTDDMFKIIDTINIDIKEEDILNHDFEVNMFGSSNLYLENVDSLNELKFELINSISVGIEMTNNYMKYFLENNK